MARSAEALTGKPQKQFGTLCQLKVYAVFSGLNRKDLAGILLFRQKINFFFFFFLNFCRDTVGGECLEATQLDKTDGN